MSFFKPDLTADAVKESTGGSFLGSSGIYDVTLKTVSVDVSKNGATSLNFNVDYNGNPSTIYGLYISDSQGKPLFGAQTFTRLCAVAKVEDVSDPVEEEHTLGKDNKPVTLAVLQDFSDLVCKIRVQEEYSKYNGEIKKKLVIKNFYTEDGASASEVIAQVNGESVTIGTQLAKDQEYASNVTYKDGLTAEDIEAWKKAKSGKTNSAPTASVSTTPKTSLFKK